MKVVFIAGPLSGISNGQEFEQGIQEQYVRVAVEAGIQLLQAGYAPFIPHLSWYIDPYTKYHEWYEADLEFVRRCDLVLRLPGLSNGAHREVALADELGIPVYHSLAEMFYVDDMTKALTQIDQPEPTPISPKAFCTECGAEENPVADGFLLHNNGCPNTPRTYDLCMEGGERGLDGVIPHRPDCRFGNYKGEVITQTQDVMFEDTHKSARHDRNQVRTFDTGA